MYGSDLYYFFSEAVCILVYAMNAGVHCCHHTRNSDQLVQERINKHINRLSVTRECINKKVAMYWSRYWNVKNGRYVDKEKDRQMVVLKCIT
jgi:hypothetical protein